MGCNVTTEWVSGNIFIRPMLLMKAGDFVPGHAHNFDHTWIVFQGAATVKGDLPDGRVIEREFKSPRPDYAGPSHALIKAGVRHTITATEDGTLAWCVYAHRNPQGEVVQEYNGWADAYG